jgi:hypothetical protein
VLWCQICRLKKEKEQEQEEQRIAHKPLTLADTVHGSKEKKRRAVSSAQLHWASTEPGGDSWYIRCRRYIAVVMMERRSKKGKMKESSSSRKIDQTSNIKLPLHRQAIGTVTVILHTMYTDCCLRDSHSIFTEPSRLPSPLKPPAGDPEPRVEFLAPAVLALALARLFAPVPAAAPGIRL